MVENKVLVCLVIDYCLCSFLKQIQPDFPSPHIHPHHPSSIWLRRFLFKNTFIISTRPIHFLLVGCNQCRINSHTIENISPSHILLIILYVNVFMKIIYAQRINSFSQFTHQYTFQKLSPTSNMCSLSINRSLS